MGLLHPDPLNDPEFPEDPEDFLPTVENLERWIEEGDDYHLAKFGLPPSPAGIASAEPQQSVRQYRAPNVSNARAARGAAQDVESPSTGPPLSKRPGLHEFLKVAGPDNPHQSTRELTRYWNEKYGHVDPKTLPILETFLAAAKQDNPDKSDHELTSYWGDHYGALGAPEKNSVASSPGLLGTAKDLGLKTVAGMVDAAKEVGRKVTSHQQNPPIRQNSPTPTHPPSLLEFVKANRPLNPHMPVSEIAQVWNKDWGHVDPKTLPSKETFLAKNKPLNPDVPEADLAQHWDDHYGSLGAPKKNPPVTALPKMMGQATAARTRP